MSQAKLPAAIARGLWLAVLVWAGASQSALGQTLGQGQSVDVPWWRVAGALLICLALAVGGAFALKTRLRGAMPMITGRDRRLRLMETLRLSHQADICLLSCDDREYIVASTPHGVVLVAGGAVAPRQG